MKNRKVFFRKFYTVWDHQYSETQNNLSHPFSRSPLKSFIPCRYFKVFYTELHMIGKVKYFLSWLRSWYVLPSHIRVLRSDGKSFMVVRQSLFAKTPWRQIPNTWMTQWHHSTRPTYVDSTTSCGLSHWSSGSPPISEELIWRWDHDTPIEERTEWRRKRKGAP